VQLLGLPPGSFLLFTMQCLVFVLIRHHSYFF
jgi:hypothetical protein